MKLILLLILAYLLGSIREEILGEKVYANVTEIDDPIDIVDVFRRSEFLPEVAADFLKTDAKVFWAQLGIENEEADEMLRKAGRTDVVILSIDHLFFVVIFIFGFLSTYQVQS